MKLFSKNALAVAAALVLGTAATSASAGEMVVGNVSGQAGANVVVPVSFAGDGATVESQGDVVFPAEVSFVSATPANGGGCSLQAAPPNTVRITSPTGVTTPAPAGPTTYCNITFEILAATPEGTYPVTIDDASVICFDGIGNDTSAGCTGTDGAITVVTDGPPTLTFDTTPVALPGGPFGSTQSGTIPANFTASTGAHSVDYTCTAPAGFTVTPATGSYDNDDTTATDLTVTATLTGAAQTGTVTCTVTPSDGSTPTTFDIDVSAPAGAETAPVLDPTPASGGTVTVGGGAPGSNGTGTLVVTPDGGAGTDVAEVSCTADAPVSISPASLSFPVGSSPQNFTVTVPLTDAAQSFPGAITCSGTDGNGTFEWVFDVSAPAGVAAPTFIPATSLWSKFALIGVFAALGLLMVGLRRNH